MKKIQGKDLSPEIIKKFRYIEETLYIEELGSNDINRESAGALYCRLLGFIKNQTVSELRINLHGADYSNIYLIAFIDSAQGLCIKNKIKNFLNGTGPKWDETIDKFKLNKSSDTIIEEVKKHKSIFFTAGEATIKILQDSKKFLGFIGELTSAMYFSIKNPRKIQWREALYYMDKSGADAVPIVTLLCFLMGAILGFQGVIQMGRFGLATFTANLVGLSIVKELGALLVAIICVGRAGSAFAAEIGTMKLNEEIDAMETMGLNTSRFLVIPKLIALICVMPFLTVIGDIAGIFGGIFVASLKSGISMNEFYGRTILAISGTNIFEGIAKSVVYAILIAWIGCFRGMEADNDAKGVGRAATSAVVSGIFCIVVADAIITLLFN